MQFLKRNQNKESKFFPSKIIIGAGLTSFFFFRFKILEIRELHKLSYKRKRSFQNKTWSFLTFLRSIDSVREAQNDCVKIPSTMQSKSPSTPPQIIKTQAHSIVWNSNRKESRSGSKMFPNNSLLLQGKKKRFFLTGYQNKKSPPVRQPLGSAISMKRPCSWGRLCCMRYKRIS